MTYLEKLKKEHPEKAVLTNAAGCPHHYGYCSKELNDPICNSLTCTECWNREIPGTKKITKTKKEKETMKNTIEEPKKELTNRELIDKKNEEIKQLKKEIADLEKFEKYNKVAHEIHLVKESFKNNGFNDEEALKLTLELINNVIPRV